MLAISDWNGYVGASVPGLARIAKVEVEDCRNAVRKLMEPDGDSRTKEFEGRRIREVDGGWVIINYVKYRDLGKKIDRQLYLRDKQRQYRQCKQTSTGEYKVSTVASVSVSEEGKEKEECEEKEETQECLELDVQSEACPNLDQQAEAIYEEYPRKASKPHGLRAIKKAIVAFGFDLLLEKTKAYAKVRQTENDDYTPHPSTWFNGHRFNDDPKTWKDPDYARGSKNSGAAKSRNAGTYNEGVDLQEYEDFIHRDKSA